MLISAAHAFCLDYAQRPQVDRPFNWLISPRVQFASGSQFFNFLVVSVRPPSSEYCVNFRPKNINFLLRKCQAQGRHYANVGAAHVMMSPDTKMSPCTITMQKIEKYKYTKIQIHKRTYNDVTRHQNVPAHNRSIFSIKVGTI